MTTSKISGLNFPSGFTVFPILWCGCRSAGWRGSRDQGRGWRLPCVLPTLARHDAHCVWQPWALWNYLLQKVPWVLLHWRWLVVSMTCLFYLFMYLVLFYLFILIFCLFIYRPFLFFGFPTVLLDTIFSYCTGNPFWLSLSCSFISLFVYLKDIAMDSS